MPNKKVGHQAGCHLLHFRTERAFHAKPVTIAISIKINDGLVLASDSASTVLGQVPNTGELQVLNVYNNAIKVFNLRKGLPIGAITWGSGSIGQDSISTIIKDLRERFTGDDPDHPDWKLDPKTYTIEAIAEKLKQFVYDELYLTAFKDFPQKPPLGFIVAGYSARAPMADEFQIDIQDGECNGPRLLRKREESGVTWAGEPEALNRLIAGVGTAMPTILRQNFGVPEGEVGQALAVIQQNMQVGFILPAMPLQDAIDLAEFMVDVTIKFSRFRAGAPTVGGPIEIAAISKHEGFRWVQRKYYFTRELNPEEKFTRVYKPDDKEDKHEVEAKKGECKCQDSNRNRQ